MPTLSIDIAQDPPGSDASTDPAQIVTAQLFGDTYPLESIELEAGLGAFVLDAGYWWVHRFGESKLVHFTIDARLDELASIDPTTLDPEDEPEAAWEEALLLRPILTRLTQAEYDALTPTEQADPLVLYVIPVI
jgi:hypothetical protein